MKSIVKYFFFFLKRMHRKFVSSIKFVVSNYFSLIVIEIQRSLYSFNSIVFQELINDKYKDSTISKFNTFDKNLIE